MSEKTEIINIRLNKELVSWLDSLVNKGIFKTRSEAIREFSREYILTKSNQRGK